MHWNPWYDCQTRLHCDFYINQFMTKEQTLAIVKLSESYWVTDAMSTCQTTFLTIPIFPQIQEARGARHAERGDAHPPPLDPSAVRPAAAGPGGALRTHPETDPEVLLCPDPVLPAAGPHHQADVYAVDGAAQTDRWQARTRGQWKGECDGLLNITGLILGLRPANERRRYKVTPSLIG